MMSRKTEFWPLVSVHISLQKEQGLTLPKTRELLNSPEGKVLSTVFILIKHQLAFFKELQTSQFSYT